MKRGTKIITKDGYTGIVMTREDFNKYEINRPSEQWELIDYGGGIHLWTGVNIIKEMI